MVGSLCAPAKNLPISCLLSQRQSAQLRVVLRSFQNVLFVKYGNLRRECDAGRSTSGCRRRCTQVKFRGGSRQLFESVRTHAVVWLPMFSEALLSFLKTIFPSLFSQRSSMDFPGGRRRQSPKLWEQGFYHWRRRIAMHFMLVSIRPVTCTSRSRLLVPFFLNCRFLAYWRWLTA